MADVQIPAPTPEPTPGGPGKTTSEFVATLGVIGANVVGVLVLVGILPASDQSSVTTAVQSLAGGLAMAVGNAVALWRYIHSRTELKQAAVDAALAREQMRLDAASRPDHLD